MVFAQAQERAPLQPLPRGCPMRLLAALLLVPCAGSEGGLPAEVPASWKEHRLASGHVAHLEKDVRCRDCHRSRFERPSLLVCDNCHETVRDRSHHSADAPKNDCYSCHPFKEKTDVKEDACKRCHETPMHQTECLECHAPHRDPPLAIRGCVKCHEDGSNVHTSMPEIDGCSACHAGHTPKSKAAKTC